MVKLNCERCGIVFYRRPSNVGKYCSHRCAALDVGSWKQCFVYRTGEEHPLWRGDQAHYTTIHKWVVRWLGKPNKCFVCKGKLGVRFEWANASGKYRRQFSDWVSMCSKCHRLGDSIIRLANDY